MALRRSAEVRLRSLLRNALSYDVRRMSPFAAETPTAPTLLRGCGFKTWVCLNAERSWPNPEADNPSQPAAGVPEGSTFSRSLDNPNQAAAPGGGRSWPNDDKFVSGSSKPGTGKTWPNPNAPRSDSTPTYTPSSYSSSSKGGGKLWDNPNGLPYWDSKWDDPTKPELRAKGWTWDPNPANSHMGTWPADQPPPNRGLGFSSPRGGSWDNRGGGRGGGNFGGGGGNFGGGGGGGGSWDNRGPPSGGAGGPGGPGGPPGGGGPGGPGGPPGGPGGPPGGGYGGGRQ